MCELMGMSFARVVRPSLTFRGFRHRSQSNPHGWGIALYPDGRAAQVLKEPVKGDASELSAFIQDYPRLASTLFISHVRYASAGRVCYRNTHPFSRECLGQDYVFAHNGTLQGYKNLERKTYQPLGETDSEHAFCHVLDWIRQRENREWGESAFLQLRDLLRQVNGLGKFNCLLADGKRLFCYADQDGDGGLHCTRREAPFSQVSLVDEDYIIDLGEEKDPQQSGYIIATRPLTTGEGWEPLAGGELIVFHEGQLEFRGKILGEQEREVLLCIRQAPQKIRLAEIALQTQLPPADVRSAIKGLVTRGYIRQDRRDSLDGEHEDAQYYTLRRRRAEIDRM